MIGKPLYKLGQCVEFICNGKIRKGEVEIVDADGTFEQNEEPSYDIFVAEENLFCKHIRESDIIKLVDRTRQEPWAT